MQRLDLRKMIKPIDSLPAELDLLDWEDRPGRKEWEAGEQVEALKFYLVDDAKVVWDTMENEYSGDAYAVIRYRERWILWRDSFGSCCGCDALAGLDLKDGRDYILDTMQEGNTKQFCMRSELIDFILGTLDDSVDTYHWNKLKNVIIENTFEAPMRELEYAEIDERTKKAFEARKAQKSDN